jgi:hypothetical protein
MENNFTVYNKETSWNKRGKPPVVRFSKYGHIRFSVEAIRLLGLDRDTPISFMTDARDIGVIYFFVDKKGLPLKRGTVGKTGEGLQICCRPLAQRVMDFFGFNGINKTFDVTNETVKTEKGNMWIILKDKIHKPIKWKRNTLK